MCQSPGVVRTIIPLPGELPVQPELSLATVLVALLLFLKRILVLCPKAEIGKNKKSTLERGEAAGFCSPWVEEPSPTATPWVSVLGKGHEARGTRQDRHCQPHYWKCRNSSSSRATASPASVNRLLQPVSP